MKRLTNEELKNILALHKKWLNGESDGVRAELRDVDLSEENLSGIDLQKAILRNVSLKSANLFGANFSMTDIIDSDLRYADLSNANLHNAYIVFSNLMHTNLSNADFSDSSLFGSNFSEATNIFGYANFRNVRTDKFTGFVNLQCPEEGSFIGYKKARLFDDDDRFVIVKLKIAEDAKRKSGNSRMCYCDKAEVISITSFDGKTDYVEAFLRCEGGKIIYRVGEFASTHTPFFITKKEAMEEDVKVNLLFYRYEFDTGKNSLPELYLSLSESYLKELEKVEHDNIEDPFHITTPLIWDEYFK